MGGHSNRLPIQGKNVHTFSYLQNVIPLLQGLGKEKPHLMGISRRPEAVNSAAAPPVSKNFLRFSMILPPCHGMMTRACSGAARACPKKPGDRGGKGQAPENDERVHSDFNECFFPVHPEEYQPDDGEGRDALHPFIPRTQPVR